MVEPGSFVPHPYEWFTIIEHLFLFTQSIPCKRLQRQRKEEEEEEVSSLDLPTFEQQTLILSFQATKLFPLSQ